MAVYMEYMLFVALLLLGKSFGFTDLSNSNNRFNSNLMSNLVEKIGDLERKVIKLERNGKQMMESLRVLIQTNAQFQLTKMDFQNRLKNIEQECNINGYKELDDRIKNVIARLRKLDDVTDNSDEQLKYHARGKVKLCEKSRITD